MNKPPLPVHPLLLVDDEPAWLRGMGLSLAREHGIENFILCSDSREAVQIASERELSVAVIDVTMPYLTGEELLPRLLELQPDLPVVILSGRNQVEIAVRCMKLGAFDYFLKTEESDRFMGGILRALELATLRRENARLRESLLDSRLRRPEAFAEIYTCDPRLHDIFRYVEAIAVSREPVLITGESGTGKELIARAVHATAKDTGPWVAVNVAGLDDHAFSDTLFGHKRGAFTGATEARPGMIERAAGGVLFLDEIGDLSLQAQVKLLRLIQEGEFYPLGCDHPSRSQARLVFATNCNLEALVADGRFRRDLYHRLHAHHIHLPPLRERRNDIPLLLNHFLAAAAANLGKKRPTPPPELALLLRDYPFPGNLRELRALIYDAVSRHEGGVLSLGHFKNKLAVSNAAAASTTAATVREFYNDLERLPTIDEAVEILIDAALQRADGTISLAAATLGISRPALSKRLSAQKKST